VRRLLVVLALFVACGDSTGPRPQEGRYTLTVIDGAAPPVATAWPEAGNYVRSGWIELRADGTYQEVRIWSRTLDQPPVEWSQLGTYAVSGSSTRFTFPSSTGPIVFNGTVSGSGSTLTIAWSRIGNRYTYQLQTP
jgi:hypothetical protein